MGEEPTPQTTTSDRTWIAQKKEQEWIRGLNDIRKRLSGKRKRGERVEQERTSAAYPADRRVIPGTQDTSTDNSSTSEQATAPTDTFQAEKSGEGP